MDADVAIVGAGPVGASLALRLAGTGLRLRVLDARAPGEAGAAERTLAVSQATRLAFERLGVWQALEAGGDAPTAITDIEVSQRGAWGLARLEAAEVGLPALGWVIGYAALQGALDAALARAGVAVEFATKGRIAPGTGAYAIVEARRTGGPATPEPQPIAARLAVAADGAAAALAGPPALTIDYPHSALVATVRADRPHSGLAHERFTRSGPIALLPHREGYALVWTTRPEQAQRLLDLDEASFLERLGEAFGARAGAFVSVRARSAFPLRASMTVPRIGHRSVSIGNAAQTLHPVAGQGFNLGLRDAEILGEHIADSPLEALGSGDMLASYARARGPDRWGGLAFTNGLLAAFAGASPVLAVPRGLALSVLDTIPPLKRAFMRVVLHGLT